MCRNRRTKFISQYTPQWVPKDKSKRGREKIRRAAREARLQADREVAQLKAEIWPTLDVEEEIFLDVLIKVLASDAMRKIFPEETTEDAD